MCNAKLACGRMDGHSGAQRQFHVVEYKRVQLSCRWAGVSWVGLSMSCVAENLLETRLLYIKAKCTGERKIIGVTFPDVSSEVARHLRGSIPRACGCRCRFEQTALIVWHVHHASATND
jgi:hypothetical protein